MITAQNKTIHARHWLLALLGAVMAVQVYVMVFHVFTELRVKNEHYYLDEKTIMSDGSVVGNSAFEEKYLISSEVQDEYSNYPSSLNVLSRDDAFKINRSQRYEYFSLEKYGNISSDRNKFNYLISGNKSLLAWDPYEQAEVAYSFPLIYNAYYSNCQNSRSVELFYKYANSEDFSLKNNHAPTSCDGAVPAVFPLVTAETDELMEKKIEFIEKNIDGKILQIFNRYYLHESAFVLSPINEMKLGKPLGEIFSQYGFLSVIGVSTLMDALGGFSFPNYEKTVKLAYLAYYVVFVIVVFLTFEQFIIRSALILTFTLAFFANSYYFYQYAPGHVPLRHFFDFIVFLLAWNFEKRRNIGLFLLSGVAVVLSIFTDREFGLLMALAFGAAGIYYCFYQWLGVGEGSEKTKKGFSLALVGVISALSLSLWAYPLAPNPSAPYFLDGFYSFYVAPSHYAVVLASILLQALVVFVAGRLLYLRKRFFVFLFAAFYSQLLYFYFVWGGGHAHFFTLLVIYLLPYMVLLDLVDWSASRRKRGVAIGVFAGLFVLVVSNGITFAQDFKGNRKVFDDHITYSWELPRAKGMVTTVDPSPFEDAVRLIEKYEKSDNLSLISKYDSFLTILTGKVNGGGFLELRSMIVTEDEYQKVRHQLSTSDILVVDNDINRDFDAEMKKMSVWNLLPTLHKESVSQRIPKLKVLQRLYKDVVPGRYELMEKGELISIYRRIR